MQSHLGLLLFLLEPLGSELFSFPGTHLVLVTSETDRVSNIFSPNFLSTNSCKSSSTHYVSGLLTGLFSPIDNGTKCPPNKAGDMHTISSHLPDCRRCHPYSNQAGEPVSVTGHELPGKRKKERNVASVVNMYICMPVCLSAFLGDPSFIIVEQNHEINEGVAAYSPCTSLSECIHECQSHNDHSFIHF